MKNTIKKVVILGALGVALTGCFAEEGANMANEVAKETLTGVNAIENYEWFKRMEEGIKAKHQAEVIARNAIERYKERIDMKNLTAEQSGELSRLEMTLDAQLFSVNEMIADYNARSNMTNRAMFKDHLPTNIFRGVNQALDFKYGVKLEVVEKVNGGKN